VATLVWDKSGEKTYEVGVERGVLYLEDGRGIVWNGLRGMEESYDREVTPFYLDGVKYLQRMTAGDFSGRLRAFTYPEEFDSLVGAEPVGEGMIYYGQPPKKFHLSYRTLVGNDLEGTKHGYKLHILYNLMAVADPKTFNTLEETLTPVEFGWTVTGTPVVVDGYRPTVHISIDSRNVHPGVLSTVEDILYGSAVTNPRLPPLEEVTDLLAQYGSFVVVDNGDGTWTGIDLADQFITMNSDTQFTVNNVDATYSDPDTYQVSTTTP
jgi:hypothetical protein